MNIDIVEKQKLDLSNIPKLRFPEFSGEWEKKKLGELGNFIGGGTPSTKNIEFWNGNIPWISSSDLSDESINEIKTTRFINEQAVTNSATKVIPKNSILIVSRVGVGKIAINEKELCTSQDFTSLIPNHEYHHIFLAYFLKIKTNRLLEFNQGTSIKGFVKSDLETLQMEIPSLPEQQKIASFLTAVDNKLQALKKKKSLLEQYKNGVMQKIFSQELRFKDTSNSLSASFPEWEVKKLGEVCDEHLLKNSGNKYPEVFSVAKHKGIINQIEHLGRSFSANEISHYKLIFPGDMVYTKSPTADFPFGIIKQNRTGRIGVVSPLYCVFKPKTFALGYLLHEYFSSEINVYNYLNPLVQKGAKNTMNINNDVFLNGAGLNLPMDQAEQTKIANFLSAIDEKIQLVQGQVEKMEVWKKGLLQKMFV
jgi:type I restriction enzyme S subunit